MAEQGTSTPTRRHRLLVAIIVAVVILVLAGIFLARPAGGGPDAWAARLQAAGYPLTSAELAPPDQPGPNAGPLYEQAFPDAFALRDEQFKLGQDVYRHVLDPGCPAADRQRFLAMLSGYSRLFPLIHQAARQPWCRLSESRQDGPLSIPDGYGPYAITLAFGCETAGHVLEGQPDEAYQAAADGLRLANHLQADRRLAWGSAWPCQLAAQHLRLAIIARPPTAGELDTLWPLLDTRRFDGGLRWAVLMSQARTLANWRYEQREGGSILLRAALGMRVPGRLIRVGNILGRPLLDANHAGVLRVYQRMVPLTDLSGPRLYAAAARLEAEFDRTPRTLVRVREASDNLRLIADRLDAARASYVMARWALALSLYHQRYGRYPATLAAARPCAPGDPGLDPYTGRPPAYRISGKGYDLHCLGPNGRDDSGQGRLNAGSQPPNADDWPWVWP